MTAADEYEVVAKFILEEDVMGEAKDEVAEDITPIKWRVTTILTLWKKQKFKILICVIQ